MSSSTFASILVLCIGFLVAVQAQDPFERCHTQILTPHHFLNLPRFLGRWYTLEIGYSKANQVRSLNITCLSMTVSQKSENVLDISEAYWNVENGVVSSPGETHGISKIGELNPAMPIPAIWANYLNETLVSQSTVVASNEDSWALLYNCAIADDGALLERMFLLSRRRYLEPTVEDVLDTIAYGIGFQRNNVIRIEQNAQC